MILVATIGTHLIPLSLPDCRALLLDLEAAGFDAVLFARTPGNAFDPVPLVAALASVPVTIGLGASVPAGYTEPFHLARAFAAIDRLTGGRSAVVLDEAVDLAPAIGRVPPDDPARVQEMLGATTALWDSWQDDAILVDRPAGLFTDPARIRRIDHDGRYYTVRGPLNAPRPLQGWPVIVASPGPAEAFADVLLGPPVAGGTGKVLTRIAAAEQMSSVPLADGWNVVPADLDALRRFPSRPPRPATTLRDRLGLPRPANRFAA